MHITIVLMVLPIIDLIHQLVSERMYLRYNGLGLTCETAMTKP